MLKNFISLWEPIKAVIYASSEKTFKKKEDILLLSLDINYLKSVLYILSIFVETTTKLQAENYPTIYYIIPHIYILYNKLEKLTIEFRVSFVLFYFLL
jgi:hypothetical protein